MDLQRSLLIGVIAVLSFMMLTEWVAFKESHPSTQEVATSTRLTETAPSLPTLEEDIAEPFSENITEDIAEDIPQAPGLVEEKNDVPAAAIAATGAANTGRFIQVHTDVLQVAIDLQGGDIVEVAFTEYLAELDNPDKPLVLLENNQQRVYVAQSGLIGPNGTDSASRAEFSSAADRFDLDASQEQLQVDLVLTDAEDARVVKRFTFRRGDYLVDVEYLVENTGQERWQANLFGQIKRDSTPAPAADSAGMGLQPFLGAAITQPDDRFTKFSFADMAEEPFRATLPGGWIAMIQHYFLSAWIPNPSQSHTYSTRVTNSGFNIAGFTSPALTLDPGKSGSVKASFYAGPKDQYRLEQISPYLDLSVDYGWLWWIAQPLFWLLTKIHSLVGNWGYAIIGLTVLIKALFFQLSAASYRSMANMRRVQPKMVDIREQYANDKQKQSQAMMELYRKEKINPMGGCLPILVQMPVFIALYWVLMESVELRHAPFILWIDDLAVMDPYFVLPLMMGASMWFMQKLNPPPPDPMQAKIMQWMPIVFTFFFLWFPAGLVLYWVVNNLLSMAQQYVITRQIEKAASN